MSNQISLAKVCPLSSSSTSFMKAKPVIVNANSIKKIALKCPDCGDGMTLKEGKHGLTYFCDKFPHCRGNHKASKRGKPMGIPANEQTRKLRIEAHIALERLYKGKEAIMTKTEAYGFLAYSMRLKPKQAHISRFNEHQCKVLKALLDFNL
jgi:ssDNA-binding Zn-finger/Zn-ribbon topoisomerase 1